MTTQIFITHRGTDVETVYQITHQDKVITIKTEATREIAGSFQITINAGFSSKICKYVK